MNTITPVSLNTNINFNGRVDKKSAKLAKSLGQEIYSNLESKAQKMSKSTVVKLEEVKPELDNSRYLISAFNSKLGHTVNIDNIPRGYVYDAINNINPKDVDEKIIDKSIKTVKAIASSTTLNTVEKRSLKSDAKQILSVQREIGINKPFWGETKNIMKETQQREVRERINALEGIKEEPYYYKAKLDAIRSKFM